MPKRIATQVTKVVSLTEHYRIHANHEYQFNYGSSFAAYATAFPPMECYDSRETIDSLTPLPPLTDITKLLTDFQHEDIARYLSQEVIAEHGVPSQKTTVLSRDYATTHSSMVSTQAIIYRPLAETLMLLHGTKLTEFLNDPKNIHNKQNIISVLSHYEGYWDNNKITQIKMTLNRLKKYGQAVTNSSFDPKGIAIYNHAEALTRALENPEISFNGNLQNQFINSVESKKADFGKHRYVYRDIALHIMAIIGSGVVGYAVAMTFSRILTGKWTTLLQTGSERHLERIAKNARS